MVLEKEQAHDDEQWKKITDKFGEHFAEAMQIIHKEGGRETIDSSRLDLNTHRSIIEEYFIGLRDEVKANLTTAEIQEFWLETIEEYLDNNVKGLNVEIKWDRDDLLYYLSNPYKAFCIKCDKYQDWADSIGETEWECSVCKESMDLSAY